MNKRSKARHSQRRERRRDARAHAQGEPPPSAPAAAPAPPAPAPAVPAAPSAHEGAVVLAIENLEQRLFDPQRKEEFVVLVRPLVEIRAGAFVAVLGPSGSGKTTLLTVLGLLRRPSRPADLGRFVMRSRDRAAGSVEHDLKALWERNRHGAIERLRRQSIGFALQSGELLPALTVRENIAAPLHVNGASGRHSRARVDELITAFGLRDDHAHNGDGHRIARARVNTLSGGEYQRVVLARAIAHRPSIVFVDEPTSALNRELARGALVQLQHLQSSDPVPGATVMITHDEYLAREFATLIIRMAPVRGRAAGEVVEVVHHRPTARRDLAPAAPPPDGRGESHR